MGFCKGASKNHKYIRELWRLLSTREIGDRFPQLIKLTHLTPRAPAALGLAWDFSRTGVLWENIVEVLGRATF